jgi:hypothetical protein
LDVIAVYTLTEASAARVEDLELIVQPPWKIASTRRSSTTREYIGAVDLIEQLRRGHGEFDTPADFYRFWLGVLVQGVAPGPAPASASARPAGRRTPTPPGSSTAGSLGAPTVFRRMVLAGYGIVRTEGVAISLFSGAGGLDLGVEAAGYEVRAAVEHDPDAASSHEKNFGHLASPVVQRDILDILTRDLVRAAGLRGRERADLLVGGPLCTPFSKSGFWLNWKRAGLDPGASLLQAYTRILAEARPRAFLLENVYALTYNNRASRPAFGRLLTEIDAAGYCSKWAVLNAADYGVPQSRPRLFVIGVRRGEPLPGLPEPTHGGQWERRESGNVSRACLLNRSG